jgi:choline-sulfatase
MWPATPARQLPVLLITVDTLRADHLGCYGSRVVRTPAVDLLAAQGVRFENALAQVPITLPSHVVILSGTYPMWNGVRDFTTHSVRPELGLIAEAFQRYGYATAAFVSAFVLDSTWGLKRGFEVYDDQFDPRQFENQNPGNIQRRAGETVDHLLAWLKSHTAATASAKPFFVWLHLYDPHSPYDPPEPFRTRYATHLYDGEIAYTDSQLERVFDYLRKQGLYDRALIVFLSDHGESLGEHGEAEHGFFIYRSTLRVPLIVKLPRRSSGGPAGGLVVRAPVGTVDVTPTLLDLAGLEDPLRSQFQGQSLASLILGKSTVATRPVYSETYYPRDSFGWSPLRAISSGRYEYIEAPQRELYELVADAKEAHNLYDGHRSEALALRSELLDLDRRYTAAPRSTSASTSLPAETVERLKSLGYLAYSVPLPRGSEASLPDPKDRLHVFKSILRAEDLAALGRFDQSDAVLDSLRSSEPNLYLIPFMLGENAAKERRWVDSEHELLACLKLNPSFDQAVMGLGRAALAQGKLEPAQTWLELAASQNPHNFLAYYGLGLAAQRRGRNDEARRNFERAIGEKPNYAPAQQALGVLLVEMRNYQQALKPLQDALQLGEQNPILLNYLGTAYENTGEPREGIEAYRKALSLKLDYTAARLNLAFTYRQTGDPASARREFAILCSQDRALCRQYRKFFQ